MVKVKGQVEGKRKICVRMAFVFDNYEAAAFEALRPLLSRGWVTGQVLIGQECHTVVNSPEWIDYGA